MWRVFNETPPSNPPVWQDLIKKGSIITMVVWGCPIMLKIKLLIFKIFSDTWHDRPSQHVQVNRTSHSSVKNEQNKQFCYEMLRRVYFLGETLYFHYCTICIYYTSLCSTVNIIKATFTVTYSRLVSTTVSILYFVNMISMLI